MSTINNTVTIQYSGHDGSKSSCSRVSSEAEHGGQCNAQQRTMVFHGFPLALVHLQVFYTNAAHTSTSLSVSLGGSTSLVSAVARLEVDGVAGGRDRH